MKITSETILGNILTNYPETISILAHHGFHGIACPAEMWVSLEIIVKSRGILLEPLLDDLNTAIGAN
ncbi:DUF1858 domain-containing protein [bacterium]|nr:DUF1858 domain-containing protein [bacterium]